MLVSKKVINGLKGSVEIPGDKSISHRSIIIPSISNGSCKVSNLLWSEDVINTLNAFRSMGVKIEKYKNDINIIGNGLYSLKKPVNKIDLGNSGTSARLLTGLLAAQNFNSILFGDKSLSKRPMDRITNPLKLMGAKFESQKGKLPLKIVGQKLKKIDYRLKLPSAQVKSGLIFAALNIDGVTNIIEEKITRNHTEIMLESFESEIKIKNTNQERKISITGNKELKSRDITVPSDLSSASFFIVACLINKNSNLNMYNINLNPTRNGILIALEKMGAKIIIKNKKINNGEITGDLEIRSSNLKGCQLDGDIAELMIDEYPILAIAASFANSPSLFKGLGELKVKESNRLELIRYNLSQCGIECQVNGNDLYINPKLIKDPADDIIIRTDYDHRIAMSFAIMGTKLNSNITIQESECIKTSFPNFVKNLNIIGGNLTE